MQCYTHRRRSGCDSRCCVILLLSSAQRLATPRQIRRDGKISSIPPITVSKPGSSRASGIRKTSKHKSVHLGSERNSWNRGSSEMFLRSSRIFVVLK